VPRLGASEEIEVARKAHAEALQVHDRDEIDPTWSEAARAAFAADLSKLSASAGFKVVNVDCRRRSCAATLRWESYQAARESLRPIVTQRHAENCASRVVVPPPSDPASTYEARVLFDSCEGRG
jgi:hypothetical protein